MKAHGDGVFTRFLSTLSLRRATTLSQFVTDFVFVFLSTLSLRRATRVSMYSVSPPIFLSTLSLRRATLRAGYGRYSSQISIHALLAESDVARLQSHTAGTAFLSTLSLRRATFFLFLVYLLFVYFYPRSPCGERLLVCCVVFCSGAISIHALLAESDRGGVACYLDNIDFYPRSPCGERPRRASRQQPAGQISIHALLAESDSPEPETAPSENVISIHALLAESDSLTAL